MTTLSTDSIMTQINTMYNYNELFLACAYIVAHAVEFSNNKRRKTANMRRLHYP